MALAKPKIHDLEDQRIEILRTFLRSFQLDLVGCMRTERALKELFRLPEFEGVARVTMGLVLAMKRDYSGAEHHLARAATLRGEPAVAQARLSAALHCGRIDVAAALLERTELVQDPGRLRQILTNAMQVGMFSLAEKCVVELEKLKVEPAGEKSGLVAECIPDIRVATSLMAAAGVSERDIVDRVAVATSVVAQRAPEHPFVVYGFSATPDAGILYEFPLSLPVGELVELDWKISEALVDAFEDPLSELIGFSTRPFSSSLRCVA